jgi:hypothetical protein
MSPIKTITSIHPVEDGGRSSRTPSETEHKGSPHSGKSSMALKRQKERVEDLE